MDSSTPRDGSREERPASPSERLLERLLTSLIASTEEESAGWEVDDAHEDSFCLAGQGWLVATRSVDGDGAAPYAIIVAGPSGTPVLEVASTSAFGRPLGHLFARLHATAAAAATLSDAKPLLASIVAQLVPQSDARDAAHTDVVRSQDETADRRRADPTGASR